MWQSCGVVLGTRRVIEDIAADEEYHVRYLSELISRFQDEGLAEVVRAQQVTVDRINDQIAAAMDARTADQFARLMASD